jgi:acetolactate synthase I/II/III large subunit
VNGAEAALRAGAAAGIDVCFANPGTSEMELVAALDRVPGIRPVLGLFEGVVTGAADGYARVADRPALTLLHLGPGLANGLANLHNARRAHTPMVNLVGDHATWHLAADAPLTSDIESLAGAMSKQVVRVGAAADLPGALQAAVHTSMRPPTGPVTLVVPQDAAWGDAPLPGASEPPGPPPLDADVVERAASTLSRLGNRSALVLGGRVGEAALRAADAVRTATGCGVWVETFPAVRAAGAGRPPFPAVPYFPEDGLQAFADLDAVVLAGAAAPVAFFGYRAVGRSSLLPDGCDVVTLAEPGWPIDGPLDGVVATVGGGRSDPAPGAELPTVPDGDLDVGTLGRAVAALQPEGAIVVNEAATSGLGWALASLGSPPHDVLALTGGAIGQGLPCAVGAALAAPDRPVIALQADGSAMYTLQALWTMAREGLDITVVVCANQAYRILQVELHRTCGVDDGPARTALTDLSDPRLGWCDLAAGMGVPAVAAATAGELVTGLERGLAEPGPLLIEARLI